MKFSETLKLIFVLLISASLFLNGCAKSEDSSTSSDSSSPTNNDSGTSSSAALISGRVSSSSSTARTNSREFSHLIDRSSRSNLASSVTDCTAKAINPTNDSVIATVDVSDNGTYTFTESQLSKGEMYKVSVECTYEGATVKMSTYGSASTTADNASTADIDPQTTAAAAYVKKSLVKAVVKSLSSTTASGSVSEKREKALSDVNSLVNNLKTTVLKKMDDGSMEFPDDPSKITNLENAVETSITEITDSSAGSTFETAMSNAQSSDDWYVPPTIDSELAGAAAEGAAKLVCAPWTTTPSNTSDQEAQIKECAKIQAETMLLGLKWNLIIRNDVNNSNKALWGIAACNSNGFGFDDAIVKYDLKTHGNGDTSCKITVRTKKESRNGDHKGGNSFRMDGYFFYKLAEHMKKGTKYTLQDIDNLVFKSTGSGDNKTGWGAYWTYMSDGKAYVYDKTNGFKKWWEYQCDNSGNCNQVLSNIDSVVSPNDTFLNKYSGNVPSYENIKNWLWNTKTHINNNSINSETYVIITEEPKRGKEDNGDTNYCEDNDPTTTCTTQKGNSIDEKKITIGLTFNKLTSSDVSNNPQRTGFRYISAIESKYSTVSKNKKNFYLRPIRDINGATGAFGLINTNNGKELRNPWGEQIELVIIQNKNWCDSASAKFNYTLDNGTAQSLGCVDSSIGKAVELWKGYSSGNSTYSIPKDSPSFISISDNTLTTQLNESKEFHFRRGADTEYTFKCSLNSFDDCSGGATDEYPSSLSPIVYGDWGSTKYLKFSITSADNGSTITFDNSSGTYYAEESWDCTGSTCSQKFFFFPSNAQTVNSSAQSSDLILYRGDNDSLLTNTRFGVKAYQINGAAMATILANVSDAFDSHYFQGPVANPNWSSAKDPWKVVGKDNSSVTFTDEWMMGDWFRKPVWSRDLSASDMTVRCSYFDNGSNSYSSNSYQTLCESLGARSSLDEAIENLRWQAINWSKLSGTGYGPFVPESDSSKSLRDKWQVVNYAREALWKRELTSTQKEARCDLFSTEVNTDNGTVNLNSLCDSAVSAATAPEAFWSSMDTNCFGVWNDNYTVQLSEPVLGQDKCIKSAHNTTLNNLSGNSSASIDIDGDGNNDSVKKWEKWKLINKATEAVWNRNLSKTVRQNRCSNLSADNSSSSSDSAFDNITTSLKDVCLSAVNSDSAITNFDSAMTALTDGPFVNWTLKFDNGTKRIPVSGSQPWEKTYKLILEDGTAIEWDNSSNSNVWWKRDPRATDNTTFPGKHTVAQYLQEVMWNVKSQWNQNGLDGNEISKRCQFFVTTDNISNHCSKMPTFIEAKSVLDNQSRLWNGIIPFFVNTNDSRIEKRSSNGFLFDDPDSTLTLYTRVFPKDVFDGNTSWSSTSEFTSEQLFALIFTFFESRSQTPIPNNPVYGVLDNLSLNQKKWLDWTVMSPSFMGDEKDLFLPLINALDNYEALR
tara:strand:- start:154 stop:4509 length:4356 start_codon:yes stop_codon:yes gene_type:complete